MQEQDLREKGIGPSILSKKLPGSSKPMLLMIRALVLLKPKPKPTKTTSHRSLISLYLLAKLSQIELCAMR